ncbi:MULTISPECIES: hypothetical protein [Sphingobium]|uniref:hypothetical protein n=1 Tax=Sphingobium TaxID=165695 RepID=UPI0015EC2084|nr:MULTISPECIES: hypothetical protein [Sphingobium]MCW2362431.1 hypothetical protein [Sphingobium sp. B10D3B]MCW2400890.1 hypothetical protein [Sphingobium sp. B10D7B]MCW2407868.1 hypothetical protein [Sphingobium xanthum]
MTRTDRDDAVQRINRALFDVALKWGVDPNKATHSPVFWHDGSLNYYDHRSHREAVFRYLKGRGVLGDGHIRAFKLMCDFDDIDQAADADYCRGVDVDEVVSFLVMQLIYQFGELFPLNADLNPQIVMWSERTSAIIDDLRELGYVERVPSAEGYVDRWTKMANPAMRASYLPTLDEA